MRCFANQNVLANHEKVWRHVKQDVQTAHWTARKSYYTF